MQAAQQQRQPGALAVAIPRAVRARRRAEGHGVVSAAKQARSGPGQPSGRQCSSRQVSLPALQCIHPACLTMLPEWSLRAPCSYCQVGQELDENERQSWSIVTGLCRHDHAWSQAVGIPHLFLGSLQDGSWGDAEERPPERPTQPLRRQAASKLHLLDLTRISLSLLPHTSMRQNSSLLLDTYHPSKTAAVPYCRQSLGRKQGH